MKDSFDDFALGMSTFPDQGAQILPRTDGPTVQISKIFIPQSFFDSTQLAQALVFQSQGQAIASGTLVESQISGFAVGLAPSSQTPVAVQFKAGGSAGSSGAYILKPGQVVRPVGLVGAFTGFSWGLPFGWLGGGMANLWIFQSPDAKVDWHGNPEVVFHRTRITITQPGSANVNAANNWPLRFPWSQAISNGVQQQGSASLGVEPTRCIITLRSITSLASPADMRILFQGSNDFSLNSSGVKVLTTPIFDTVTWPQFSQVGGGNMNPQHPALMFGANSMLNRVACDDGGIMLVDVSNGGAGGLLSGGFVDFCRYGRL